MKRQRNAQAKTASDPTIEVSSLIDICFLLLIYFLVTSTIMPAERDLPTGSGGPGPGSQVDTALISIDAKGQVFMGKGVEKVALDADENVRDLPLLTARLEVYKQGVKAAGEECLVVIDAEDDTKNQRVIDVLNALAGLEIDKVTFVDRHDEE